jgi:hypothetical protein
MSQPLLLPVDLILDAVLQGLNASIGLFASPPSGTYVPTILTFIVPLKSVVFIPGASEYASPPKFPEEVLIVLLLINPSGTPSVTCPSVSMICFYKIRGFVCYS